MPEMKDSGIDWVGEIPKDWNTTKIKYNFDIINGYSFQSSLYSDDGIRVIRISDVEDDYLSDKDVRYYPDSFAKSIGTAMLKKDDILVTLTGYVGKCYQLSESDTNLGLNQRVGALRSITNNYNVSYMRRVIQCESFRKKMELNAKGSAQLNMSTEWFKNNTVPCPSILEQTRIAAFLESKCSEIDALRSDIEKEIETLEQYKQSVITETVTKGLDKNADMKDSGIEWVGQIPANWEMKKLKYVSKVRSNKVSNNTGNDYFALENIVSWTGKYIETDNEYDTTGSIYCYKNDVAFGKLRPYLAKVYYVDYDRCCSSEFAVFYNFIGNSRYYYYVLLSKGFIDLANSATCGIKMPRVKIDFLNNMYIPIPPIKEQDAIADRLNNMCSEIDSIITNKKKQLETLDSYKKSIIYEYVTGKKEVPA